MWWNSFSHGGKEIKAFILPSQVVRSPVATAELGESLSNFQPLLTSAMTPAVASSTTGTNSSTVDTSVADLMDAEAKRPYSRRTRRRKLLLPANTRKINREAQQRFRLKQKVRLDPGAQSNTTNTPYTKHIVWVRAQLLGCPLQRDSKGNDTSAASLASHLLS